ncbi:fungal-specific transcription factor domain-containing protein [Calycina marina]|uniref:Fungal-specific transcription factor domain-containing protein n=1 Tax=Calycina marina TaxID=1763456 RepID=A0A9P8CC70_9HELO|nr:fungal-specific transcription factor domain-containing protein [Calycina marina]
MSSASNTSPDGYVNDLSQPTGGTGTTGNKKRQRSPVDANGNADGGSGGYPNQPKPKLIACIICRKRKLRCDGTKPSCSTCTRLGHSCAYDEVRRKSGPKRGYVKALEERLKRLETLLRTQNAPATPEVLPTIFTCAAGLAPVPTGDLGMSNSNVTMPATECWRYNGESPPQALDNMGFTDGMDLNIGLDDNTFTWEMIGLGLEEPLPYQDTIDELHQIYFNKIHPSIPMVHKYRYLAAMNLAPSQRPPVALRYAIWTLAASVTERYMDLRDHFYQRARKYVESDVLKGHGENILSIAHAQTHVLLSSYEFKMMYFPRAWMSTGAAVRMTQMLGLHRLDGAGLDVKECLPPPRDWTEREERRRTFWMAFCQDRYASIGTGWPMTFDERDMSTDMPSSDEAFDMSKAERTFSLADSMAPAGASKLSAFGSIVLMACLFGRNLAHLHRPDSDDRDNDLNGEFWKRHRNMDNILLNTSLSMPSHLKLPRTGHPPSPNIVFTNMNIHTSTICLHQAAIFKAEKNHLPASISAESKARCITAAGEVASIMRMISHMDLSAMNPFISFCLYVAARVFVQYLKSKPDDSQTGDSLRFLLFAMNALKRKNPLTESFLVQLDVDLESLGVKNPIYKDAFAYEKLGISMGPLPPTVEKGCNYGTINEEGPLDVGHESSPNFQNNTEMHTGAASGSNTGADSHFDNMGTDWNPAANHRPQRGRNMQTSLQGLAIESQQHSQYHAGDMNGVGCVNSDHINSVDAGLSPDTGSNQPTPSSRTPSGPCAHVQAGRKPSGARSYETSPSPPHDSQLPSVAEFNSMGQHGSVQQTYNVVPPAGMAPDSPQYNVPNGWDMNPPTSGLTPVGEGVFRQLMGLGHMESMNMAWGEGPS